MTVISVIIKKNSFCIETSSESISMKVMVTIYINFVNFKEFQINGQILKNFHWQES